MKSQKETMDWKEIFIKDIAEKILVSKIYKEFLESSS